MTRRRMSGERGVSMVFWLLSMCMVVLMLAGICIDMWRLVAAERALATAVDAAAAAGANGLDEDAYRADGTVQLDPARAEALAADALNAQPEAATITAADISATTERVTVLAETTVGLTLTRLFLSDDLVVHAAAAARPERS